MTFKEWFTQRGDAELGAKIKAATSFRMNSRDREAVRAQLLAYARMRPARPRAIARTGWSALIFHPVPVLALSVVVVMGGTAGAAERALPGDLLYPIKVNVNEEMRAALATTPRAQASVALLRAETRLEELAALEERDDLDENVREEAEERLDNHVRAAEEKALDSDDENGEREAREQRLVAILRAHESLLVRKQAEIGGSLVPEVSLEAVIAAESSVAPEVSLMSAVVGTGTSSETTRDATRAASPSAEERPPEDMREKKNAGFNEKTVARQKRAAKQRIDALQKLLLRVEKRVSEDVSREAHAAFTQATTDLLLGEQAFDEKNLAEASFRFNTALTISIDARELLSKAPRSHSGGERTKNTETHKEKDSNAASAGAASTGTPETNTEVNEHTQIEFATTSEKAKETHNEESEEENKKEEEEEKKDEDSERKKPKQLLDELLQISQ